MVIRVQDIKESLKVNDKMKKTYISPNMLVVRLGMIRPIAGSLTTDGATFYNENATGDAMVDEYNPINDKNIWDDEW